MRIIPIHASAGITGFESPASEYLQLALSLDEFVCKILDKPRRQLLSSNENHQPQPINDYDSFSIEGVVIRSIRCHRQSPLLAGK